eukprot:scaffold3920_cov262-Pinguiococcus_pyrenoidosus.AAC.3
MTTLGRKALCKATCCCDVCCRGINCVGAVANAGPNGVCRGGGGGAVATLLTPFPATFTPGAWLPGGVRPARPFAPPMAALGLMFTSGVTCRWRMLLFMLLSTAKLPTPLAALGSWKAWKLDGSGVIAPCRPVGGGR